MQSFCIKITSVNLNLLEFLSDPLGRVREFQSIKFIAN